MTKKGYHLSFVCFSDKHKSNMYKIFYDFKDLYNSEGFIVYSYCYRAKYDVKRKWPCFKIH